MDVAEKAKTSPDDEFGLDEMVSALKDNVTSFMTAIKSMQNGSLQPTEDVEGEPMTADWLQPDHVVQPASAATLSALSAQSKDVNTSSVLAELQEPAADPVAVASTAADDDAIEAGTASWHPAIAPPAVAMPKHPDKKGPGSILALLGADAKTRHSAVADTSLKQASWQEHLPGAVVHENHDSHGHKLPGQLGSLLETLQQSPSPAHTQESSDSPIDLDALLADV
jgi:hypothetical protein